MRLAGCFLLRAVKLTLRNSHPMICHFVLLDGSWNFSSPWFGMTTRVQRGSGCYPGTACFCVSQGTMIRLQIQRPFLNRWLTIWEWLLTPTALFPWDVARIQTSDPSFFLLSIWSHGFIGALEKCIPPCWRFFQIETRKETLWRKAWQLVGHPTHTTSEGVTSFNL